MLLLLPHFQSYYRWLVIKSFLWDVVILQLDVTRERLRQILTEFKAMGIQHLSKARLSFPD